MGIPLRVLIVEDSEDDTILVVRELQRGGYEPTSERVDTPEAMNAALEQQAWDIVLCDYAMPRFSMPAALAMVKEKGLDLPFIIVSGAIGEEAAVAAMRAGACDYVMKGNLARLAPAVERELREAEVRRERKRAEEALQESEEKFRAIFNEARDGVVLIDFQTGRIRDCNPEFENQTGRKLEQLRKMKIWEMRPPEKIGAAKQKFSEVKRKGAGGSAGLEFQKPDGQIVPIEFKSKVVTIRGRRYLQSIARDITERKQAEEALRESEEHYSALVGNLTDAVFQFKEGGITWCNDRVEEIYGYPKDELLGKSASFFYPSDISPSEFTRRVAAAIKERGFFRSISKFQRTDGNLVDIEYSLSQIPGKDPVEVIAVARDVTDRKRMEQQLQLAGRLAAVGELAAGVAHELNNPLAAVQAFAQFLADKDNLDETTKSDVETIYREAQRATRITANLLRFAHRHKPEIRLVSINETLEKSLQLHAYRMKVNNIEILVEPDPDLPMIMADFHQMQQVFVNIINNAEQAMTEAHSKGKLRVETQRVGEMIRIAFTDDGPGISEDNLKRIFDPFFTTKDVGKGTGLGLSICYGIVEEHGGHMYARSKPGKGATFVVELPIASDDQPVAEQAGSIEG